MRKLLALPDGRGPRDAPWPQPGALYTNDLKMDHSSRLIQNIKLTLVEENRGELHGLGFLRRETKGTVHKLKLGESNLQILTLWLPLQGP